MILGTNEIAEELQGNVRKEADDPLFVSPSPDINELKGSGSTSIDLRLGTWFLTTKLSRHSLLDIYNHESEQPHELNITSRHYIPFGKKFILHPRSFVLATTLEWIRMPRALSGYVTGKSSWGRRGLVIETAPGVHPGFSGCLTLELANLGELPIALLPGTKICQLFFHYVKNPGTNSCGSFLGYRQPLLGKIKAQFALSSDRLMP